LKSPLARLPLLLLTASLSAALLGAAPPAVPATAPPVAAQERFGESLDVRLAELYVTVTQRDGSLVRDLVREDFVVRENGVEQKLDEALPSLEQPVTLGVAMDTSASMFVKLGPATRAAGSLIGELMPDRDHAFLVGFGPEPTVAQATTNDLPRVKDALRSLEPAGRTPLWASITYSLAELGRSQGKRALVVFLDGADSDGSAAYRECLRAARRLGAPIYLIVMNNEAARSEGRDFQTRTFVSRLEKVAAAGGGAVFYVTTTGDLSPIYQRIEEEIRSAYLLTYTPTVPLSAGGTRKVEVAVKRKGLKVKSLGEYEPK
jgi:Ca-activated chloride channel homolog